MIHQHAFFCGHFTIEGKFDYKVINSQKWEAVKEVVPDNDKESFYLNFQKFMLSRNSYNTCSYFRKIIKETIRIGKGEKNENSVYVEEIRLFIFPYNVAVFSIEVEQKSESVKRICSVTRMLRNCRYYKDISQEWTEKITNPIRLICQTLKKKKDASFQDIVENSDRMKVFQIVFSDDGFDSLDKEDRKCLLYNLCTADSKTDNTGVKTDESLEYIMEVIHDHSFSVFKEWDALSLLDSFTVLYYSKSPKVISRNPKDLKCTCNDQNDRLTKCIYDDWRKRFRLFYIYALFQKCYLYKLNNLNNEILYSKRYDKRSLIKGRRLTKWYWSAKRSFAEIYDRFALFIGLKKTELAQLTSDLNDFEFKYVFHNISYFRFTTELYASFYKGLEVEKEREEVNRLINAKQNEVMVKKENTINMVIFTLTLFTLFEAVLAACELINKIIPYCSWLPSEEMGYFIFSIIFLSLFGKLIWNYIRDTAK